MKYHVTRITNDFYQSNTYLVEYKADFALVIDPGYDWDKIESTLKEQKLVPTHIFCTHGHFDHIGSVAQIMKNFGAIAAVHKADLKLAKTANFLMMAFGLNKRIQTPNFDTVFSGGEKFIIGEEELLVKHVPGHSKGSCFFFFDNLLFSGDTLYSDGIGLPSPEQNDEILRSSLLKNWREIPSETIVCPGHGETKSFGEIRQENKSLLNFLGL